MRNKIALALFTFLFGCIGITNVDPGNVGVEVNRCSGGGVSKDPLPVGYQFTGPCTDRASLTMTASAPLLVKVLS